MLMGEGSAIHGAGNAGQVSNLPPNPDPPCIDMFHIGIDVGC